VPESAVEGRRLVGELVDKLIAGQLVFGGSEVLVQNQEEIAGLNMVEGIVELLLRYR
jgi:hypothetical protein